MSVIPVFLHQSLSSHQSSNPFRPAKFRSTCFLLPGGRHFITSSGNLPSSILWTCPYNWSWFVSVSFKRHLVTFIFLFNNVVPNFVLPINSSWASQKVRFCGTEFWHRFFLTPCFCCVCSCTFHYCMINMGLCFRSHIAVPQNAVLALI